MKKYKAIRLAAVWRNELNKKHYSLFYFGVWLKRWRKIGRKYGIIKTFKQMGVL